MIKLLKDLIDLKQRKKIKVLNLMLGDKCKEIYALKKEVARLVKLSNNTYSEKSALKSQVDDQIEAIAQKDLEIHNLKNPNED